MYVLRVRDFPYNPILGMGCFDHQSYSREGSGFLGESQKESHGKSGGLKVTREAVEHAVYFSKGTEGAM